MSRSKQRTKSSASDEPAVDESSAHTETPVPAEPPANGGTEPPVSVDSDSGETFPIRDATDAVGTADATEVSADGRSGAQQIDALQKKYDEEHERLLRVSADYQNYVRRSVQNIAVAKDQQLMDIAKALITVIDHFDRALDADPQKSTTQSLFEGVQIVREELLKTLERFGVERLNVSVGEPFDPTCHEALMRQGAEGLETDHIVAQIQPGYALRDKTIRAAKVSVST